MKKSFLFLLISGISSMSIIAQNVTITPEGITPSMNYPRLSYEAILALPNPKEGDLVYDLTFKCLRIFNGNKWVCTLIGSPGITPNLAAISTISGPDYDSGKSIAIDTSGNVYITGAQGGTTSFGGTVYPTTGESGVYLAKYNANGVLEWVQSAIGTGIGLDIEIDINGNLIVTGYFYETVSFGNISVVSNGMADFFLAKYTSDGTLLWAKSAGASKIDIAYGVSSDKMGNILITGHYTGTTTFDNTTLSSVDPNFDDVFIAKYNGAGNLIWVKSAGGISGDFGLDIATDSNNNIYITGYYILSAKFGNITITSTGANDVFLVKYDPNGETQWVRSGGGSGIDSGVRLAVDANGNVYLTGYFSENARFTSPFGNEKNISSAGSVDIFLVKYDTNGTLQWLRSMGGSNYDSVKGIAVDATGSVYLTGSYHTSATFWGGVIFSAGFSDIFVVKHNNNGDFQWVKSAGGANGDSGEGIAIDRKGYVYVIGEFSGSANFGSTAFTSAGFSDVIIAKFDK